ncbi:MAG: Fis family transcriptional regulator [Candidatus Rokuibacteriota bacterium]|nr:MAG: Fis family transcriptional regulator [Candidatus Rokubacteria bacterium]
MAAILVVDDESSARTTLALLLKKRGHRVTDADGVRAAVKALAEEAFEVIVTDLRMPDGDGLDVLRAAKAHCPEADVILLTAFAGWESAKEAIQLGAFDYFEKGREPDELLHRIDKALAEKALQRENANLRAQVRDRYGLPGLIAGSPPMVQVLELVRRVAPTDATVLIQGESGTGKEVIAKAIHHASDRARGPFVAVNCGALPEPLLESEIFGHVKGAFTGASVNKKGLFEEAAGGTLLLDEIGEMPPTLQVKLLRALQSGEVRPVGSTQAITVDVRVVAATNRDLEQMIREGGFREDLFYRLNVIPVELPPLRERREDIPRLAEHFLGRFAQRQGRALRLSPAAMERLLRYPWPGNVRELENVMERTAILAQVETIEPDDLPPHVTAGLALGPAPNLGGQQTLADAERIQIIQTLERCGRNHSRAARQIAAETRRAWAGGGAPVTRPTRSPAGQDAAPGAHPSCRPL